MVDATDDALELVPSRYDAWRERFRAERERIRTALDARSLDGRVERIEHVGSTAVPEIAAKDVVDLDIVVEDGAVSDVSRALVAELGGDRAENTDSWHPVFRRHDGQRFNDHVFAVSDDGWKTSVVTREVLRARPDLRGEYEGLKRELAAEHDDLYGYSTGKTDFVGRVLDVARADDDLALDVEIPDPP